MHDPHLVALNAVVETIGMTPNAEASEFRCPINHWSGVRKKSQKVLGPLDRVPELPGFLEYR
jgi:hypothetical protein